MHKLNELKVWKKAMEIVEMTYLLSTKFPGEEKFGLTSQIRRSAVSIPSNIAEGAERFSDKEFARFLYIARESAAELRTQLYIANKINLIDHKRTREYVDEVTQLYAMLHGLAKSLNPKP